MREQQNREREGGKGQSHLRVEMVALTLSAGLRNPSLKCGPAAE